MTGLQGADPRLGLPPGDAAPIEDAGPLVGRPPGRGNGALTIGVFVALGAGLFVLLNGNRSHSEARSLVTPTSGAPAAYAPPPPLQTPAAAPPPAPPSAPLAPLFGLPPPPTAIPAMPPPAAGLADAQQRRRAPAVVVDLGAAGDAAPAGAAAAGEAPAAGGASPSPNLPVRMASNDPSGAAGGSQAGANEQFMDRVGEGRPDRARAITLRNLDSLVPQGATILAVLETAIDSDLPGYTRAVVSRDVLSFDGKAVLIPRGSRVIGQYKSAVSLGASRAFVIWTRVIRPDGVSIQIASPGADALGRGGLAGEVNRHFFQRFGGSILLSVLNAGIASVARNPSTTITIGSPGAAVGAATSAVQGDAIPPTIRVAQGYPVTIFVARDLDFSGVATVR